MRARRLIVPLTLSLTFVGCKREIVKETSGPDPTVTFETEVPPTDSETEIPPLETAETGETETETEPVETGEPGPLWSDATLTPSGVVVGAGARLPLRLRATARGGVRTTPSTVGWVSSDLAVASVVDGVLVANGPGTVTVTARFDGFEVPTTITVADDDALRVRVIDVDTGAPVVDAEITIGQDEYPVRTDKAGAVVVEGVSPEPLTLSVLGTGFVSMTMVEVVSRDLTVAVRSLAAAQAEVPVASGLVDMDDLSAGVSEVAVGIVGPTFTGSPYWFDWSDIVGPAREITMLGVNVMLPSNVVIQDNNESWGLTLPSGTYAFWSLATVLPLAEALAAGNGDGDAFSLVAAHLDEALWGVIGPVEVTDYGLAGPLPLVAEPNSSTLVVTPARPDFAEGTENALVLALGSRDEGLVTVGLGTGFGGVTVRHVASPAPERVLGLYQQSFLGSGMGTSVTTAPVVDGTATLPAWIDIPQAPTLYGLSKEIRFNADPDAQIVVATMYDREGHIRDFYAPAGVELVDLPTLKAPFNFTVSDWSLRVLALDVGCYEQAISSGAINEAALGDDTVGAGIWGGSVVPLES
jgi:hypothetical protein